MGAAQPSWAVNYVATSTFSADGNPHFPAVNAKGKRLYTSDVAAGTVTMFESGHYRGPAHQPGRANRSGRAAADIGGIG